MIKQIFKEKQHILLASMVKWWVTWKTSPKRFKRTRWTGVDTKMWALLGAQGAISESVSIKWFDTGTTFSGDNLRRWIFSLRRHLYGIANTRGRWRKGCDFWNPFCELDFLQVEVSITCRFFWSVFMFFFKWYSPFWDGFFHLFCAFGLNLPPQRKRNLRLLPQSGKAIL